MYICCDEGHIFDEPKHYIETHGQECPPYEEYDGCPYCGGAYEEADYCDHCQELYSVKCLAYIDGERLCFVCQEEVEDGCLLKTNEDV